MSESEEKEKKAYEARLQRRLVLLRKQFEDGKIRIPNDAQIKKSLMAMRYAHDGSVDLNTVDGLVRSMALAVEGIHEREEAKKSMSLAEIQSIYFSFLEKNFGDFHKVMLERKLNPHVVAKAFSGDSKNAKQLVNSIPAFHKTVEEFWLQTYEAAYAHVEDMQNVLKGVFGGDLFPSYSQNIASKCGLYTDILILPDPFIRSKDIFERGKPEGQAYYFIKHGLSLLQYKQLACADVNPPIVVVLPDIGFIKKDELDFVVNLGRSDALIHAGKVFGRKFESIDELMAFARPLDTVDRVIAQIADNTRVVFNVEWEELGIKDKIVKATQDESIKLFGLKNPGTIVAVEGVGRMIASNELLIKAQRLQGTPVIDAPTSWQYFVWKLEYDAEKVEMETNLSNLHVLRGLESLAKNEMEWLGRVPPEALIEVRKKQALAEIRSILGNGINELAQANPTNFHRTSDHVFDNIQTAFKQHRKNIKKLSDKKWRFAGSDIGSWLVVGTLAVTAAATGSALLGVAAYASTEVLNAPKLREIPKSIKYLARESKKIKRSPVGMLFKYSGEKI